MKKFTNYLSYLILVFLAIANDGKAQQFKFHAEYEPSWYGAGFDMVSDIPGYVKSTLLASSADDQFVIEADNGYNRWKKNGLSLTTNINEVAYYEWTAGINLNDNYLTTAATVGHYYTFRLKNVGYQSTAGVMMETNNAPVNFTTGSSVSQFPLANSVNSSSPVTISFSLENAPSPQEKFYLRYSTDGYLTSSLVLANFSTPSSVNGTAIIPAMAAGTNVSYYLFSTTFDLSNPIGIEIDLVTLIQKNNSGANYSYTVQSSPNATSNVTFRVNMSLQSVSVSGVFLAGSFNNWSPVATQMQSVGGGIFEVVVPLDTTTTIQYKFLNGNSFVNQELVPAECGIPNGVQTYDRNLVVPNVDTTLPIICFGACINCPNPTTVGVTFRVNMALQTVSPDGVHLAGSFNGFSATATPMVSIGGGVYEAIVDLDTTTTITYKFINGISFATQEGVPQNCGVDNGFGGFDRFLSVPNQNTVLPTVCFSSCVNCIIPTTSNITFRVNMSLQSVSVSGVFLAGSFNNWSPTATPMQSIGGGIFEVVVPLDTTTTIQYKFLNGNSFVNQELVPAACGVPNGVQTYDRNLVVPNVDTTLPIVCFGACINCPTPTTVGVTFRVNMALQTVSPDGVHLAGSFNGFSATATPMVSIGGGVYEAIVNLDTTTTITYKFINGISFATQEGVPQNCGVDNGFGGFDRFLSVPNQNTVLPTVCFSSCVNCIIPTTSNITFRVNMSQQIVSANGVFISGSFNNWSLTANPMTTSGAGIYEATIAIDTTLTIQYKFINGNSFSNQENVPSSCGIDNGVGGFDRELLVPNVATILPIVCFGECLDCVFPYFVGVNFKVDLTNESISPNGVFIAGSFNNWNATANPLINTSGAIFETTIDLDTTQTIQYKFINGSTYEIVPTNCGSDDGTGIFNRNLVIPNVETSLNTVCFSSCSACVPLNLEDTKSFLKIEVQPNPAESEIKISNISNFSKIIITDNLGKEVITFSNENSSDSYIFNISNFAKGVYFIKCSNNLDTFTKKIVKL